MSIRLTEDMKQFVLAQRLGYHATVNPDGSPNLSAKGERRACMTMNTCSLGTSARHRR
jgi:hypothetical protein